MSSTINGSIVEKVDSRASVLQAHESDAEGGAPTVVIRPSRGWIPLNLPDLWHYRELIYFLTWRDIKVRYKQTVLGAAWAIIQPFLTMVVFSVVFGHLAKIPSEGLPYLIFAYCALLPWQLFAHALTESSNSLVAKERRSPRSTFPGLSPDFGSPRRAPGLPDRVPGADRDDGVQSRQADCRHVDRAAVPLAGSGGCLGGWPVAVGAQR